MADYIAMADCIDRRLYRIRSRNLVVGVYNEESRGFIGLRGKFGSVYPFEEYHRDMGAPHGTALPVADLGVSLPDNIPLAECGPLVCTVCRRPSGQYAFSAGPPFYRHLDDPDGTDVCREPGQEYGLTVLQANTALADWLRPYDEAENTRLMDH